MREPPNRILQFLTAPIRPDGDACRSNVRRPTSARIELAWQEAGSWRTIPARLREISRGGASLSASVPPVPTHQARLRVIEGEENPWVEVRIVEVEPESPQNLRVRLRFPEPCPSYLLRLAILSGESTVDEQGPTWDTSIGSENPTVPGHGRVRFQPRTGED